MFWYHLQNFEELPSSKLTEVKKTESHWDFRGLLLEAGQEFVPDWRNVAVLVYKADQMSILLELDPSWIIKKYSRLLFPCWEGGCCIERGQINGGGERCLIPVLAFNNQPLCAGTAPQPLHFDWLRKLPPLSYFHFPLLSISNLLRQDACVASLCLARGSNCSSCTIIYLGGRNLFQHSSFEHQTCDLAQSCIFSPS